MIQSGKENLRELFCSSGIQKKIVVIFLTIIFLLALSGSIVVNGYLNTSYKEQILQSAYMEACQVHDTIAGEIEKIYHASYVVQYDEDIIDVLKSEQKKSIAEQYYDMWNMNDALDSAILPFFIEPISIYVSDDAVYAGNNMIYRRESELGQYEEYALLERKSTPYMWLPKETIFDGAYQNVEYISFLRKIGANNDPVGYMRVNIKTEELARVLKNMVGYENEAAFLYDEHGIIASANTGKIEEIYTEMIQNPQYYQETGHWYTIRNKEAGNYFVSFQDITGTDWRMVSAIPVHELRRGIRRLSGLWFLIIVLVSILSLYLAAKISGNMTGRIRLLEKNMACLAKGNFEKMEEDSYQDEISGLIRHYNSAINQMLELHQTRYEGMKKLKNAQLQILQSQINPHFLYNTLDLIHWESLETKSERISAITQALARFYRLSLNEGKEFVSIRDEIDHVLSYLEVIDYKYKNVISYEVEIPAELYQYPIAKITLQPLIENAILHGLMEKENVEDAELEIYGWKEEDYIFIQISDNGVGMNEEQLCKMFDKTIPPANAAGRTHGYGVWNIHERLQLIYGGDCGLTYQSQPGEGTTVLVKIREQAQIDI